MYPNERYCMMVDSENEEAMYVIRRCTYIGDGNWKLHEAVAIFLPDEMEEAYTYLDYIAKNKVSI